MCYRGQSERVIFGQVFPKLKKQVCLRHVSIFSGCFGALQWNAHGR